MHGAVTLSLILMVSGPGQLISESPLVEPPCVVTAQVTESTSPFATSPFAMSRGRDERSEREHASKRLPSTGDPMLFAPPVSLP